MAKMGRMTSFTVKALMFLVACMTSVRASDGTAVYARIDRVVLVPNVDAPDTIQIWGVFSIATANNRDDYLPATRGYLYFTISGRQETVRKEWADLSRIAGVRQIVAFGSRSQMLPRVRTEGRLANPDPYVAGFGLVKVRPNVDYAPIRALLEFKP